MIRRLISDIRDLRRRDPAMRSLMDAFTSYPGLHAVWIHRITHRLWSWRLFWLSRFLAHLNRVLTGIEIHPGAIIGRRLFIDHGHGVVIGETAEVGDDCTIYHGVTLGGTTWNEGKRHPTLGNHVVVGAGAKILGPISVGDRAQIGSNAVVVKDVPSGATVVGVPARQLTKEPVNEAVSGGQEFSPYGQSINTPDPITQLFHDMTRRLENADRRIATISSQLSDLQERVAAQSPDHSIRAFIGPRDIKKDVSQSNSVGWSGRFSSCEESDEKG